MTTHKSSFSLYVYKANIHKKNKMTICVILFFVSRIKIKRYGAFHFHFSSTTRLRKLLPLGCINHVYSLSYSLSYLSYKEPGAFSSTGMFKYIDHDTRSCVCVWSQRETKAVPVQYNTPKAFERFPSGKLFGVCMISILK